MKRNMLKKKITAILFITLLFSFSALNLAHILPKINKMDNASDKVSLGNLQEQITSIDGFLNENIYKRSIFIEGYGFLHKLMGKNEMNNFDQVMDEKGYLHHSNFWNDVPVDTTRFVDSVLKLRDKVAAYGSEVIILMPPAKEWGDEVVYEKGIPGSDLNWVADQYLAQLKTHGFKVVDFRETLKSSGMTYEDIFYKTDHHWTTRAAFESFRYLTGQMNEWYDLDLDAEGIYTDINNYNRLTYGESNLGSLGRDTGAIYAGGLDSFEIIYPKYPTRFNYSMTYDFSKGMLQTFENLPFEKSLLTTSSVDNSDIYNCSMYNSYLYGVTNYDRITNLNNEMGKDVLFIRDSNSSPLAAFMSQLFHQTDLIWAYKVKGDLDAYMEGKKYDYIFVSFYPDSMKNEMFNFYDVKED